MKFLCTSPSLQKFSPTNSSVPQSESLLQTIFIQLPKWHIFPIGQFPLFSSIIPSQLLSIPSQISGAPGFIAGLLSSQSNFFPSSPSSPILQSSNPSLSLSKQIHLPSEQLLGHSLTNSLVTSSTHWEWMVPGFSHSNSFTSWKIFFTSQ